MAKYHPVVFYLIIIVIAYFSLAVYKEFQLTTYMPPRPMKIKKHQLRTVNPVGPAIEDNHINRKWSNVTVDNFTEATFWKRPANVPCEVREAKSIIPMLQQIPESTEQICESLLNKPHEDEKHFYRLEEKKKPFRLQSDEYYKEAKCDTLRSGFILKSTEAEEDFSIAFSIMVYKDVEQVYRLLRSIYRPSNYYCIHVDTKMRHDSFLALRAISKCFSNVFLSSRRRNVVWGRYSVLHAELICLHDLMKHRSWKYFINLTGQEFPLKTNLDLVKILKAYNGTSDVTGYMNKYFTFRTKYIIHTEDPKSPPPEGITIAKGNVHVVLPRAFVKFMFHDKTALAFKEWVKDTTIPDETYFPSLAHSPDTGIPGAHLDGVGKEPYWNPSIIRFKRWRNEGDNCGGEWLRHICLMNVNDLHLIPHRPELFLNKIILQTNPLAYQCLEYLQFKRTREELLGKLTFDTTFYENLEYVTKHI